MRPTLTLAAAIGLVFTALAITTTARAETSILSCSSDIQYNKTYCPLPSDVETVYLSEQVSLTPCVYGETWGLQGTYLWTAQGCAAEFVAEYNPDQIESISPDPFRLHQGVFRREA